MEDKLVFKLDSFETIDLLIALKGTIRFLTDIGNYLGGTDIPFYYVKRLQKVYDLIVEQNGSQEKVYKDTIWKKE